MHSNINIHLQIKDKVKKYNENIFENEKNASIFRNA